LARTLEGRGAERIAGEDMGAGLGLVGV